MIYNDYFGFVEEPFGVTPDPKFIFMSKGHEEALAHIMFGISHDRGFIMLTGEVGSGKTTLIRHIFQTLDPKIRTAMILNPKLDAFELLRLINQDFGLPVKGRATHKTLMDSLNKFLIECHRAGDKAVLAIDEAQELNTECLEFVRLLSNLETDTKKLLQVVLIGQPELSDIVKQPRLRQLNQRIAVRYHLRPLGMHDTERYINHRLHIAGSLGLNFSGKSSGLIYRFSGGVPRLINLCADRSLMKTFSEGGLKIRHGTVRQAVKELADEVSKRTASAASSSAPLIALTVLCLLVVLAYILRALGVLDKLIGLLW